ncbi:phage tail tape measure protein [Pseudooceanicola sp. HF7]|uniref:phage tail tape measure protein n=1 Tax=Pseudooceanicola sp. HF7 TaxID=2721560 RepID=UPI00142F59C6|nr:phage tail tape measure protein [Pseudooceanicola sp. HF7]NIZ11097.1 phage tail tape measure protein [Pseudooceanicola sp. HF7]
MATKRIETQLTIKAVDQYSSQLRKMSGATGRFAEGVRTEMGRLQQMRGPLKLIEDFRKQQGVVRDSGAAMEQAREKVRQLRREITATANPTAQMRREFARARDAAERLEQKHGQNRQTLRGLQKQLTTAGVNLRDLSGEQRRLTGALDQGTTAFGRQVAKMQRLAQMQDRIAEGRERMERSLAGAANLSFVGFASMQTGRRIMTGISGPIQKAVEFESAMADVKKVLDFESPEAFQQMSDDIQALSGRIPMAAEDLAQIVAAGGQSGLKGDQLLQFAEMAAKVGVAFDISAEQSGEAMASIRAALGTTLDETALIFDGINHLSNKMASTAPDVLNFMNRAGSAGVSAGFSIDDTMAIGSAMIAAGAGADVAATSFMNLGRNLQRGAGATDRQVEAFQRIGLQAEDVAKAMHQDASGTLIDVLERIRELPDYLRTSAVSDIFGDEARGLNPLVNNVDLLREALGYVADQPAYAGSAEAEYAERAATTANNLQLLQNKMGVLAVTIGDVLLPPLNDLLDTLQPIIERMTAWTKAHPELTKFIMAGAAATGALAVVGGVLMSAAAGLIGTLAVLRFGLVGFGARAAFAAGEVGGLGRIFRGLSRLPKFALSTLIKPLLWTGKLLPSFAPALARFAGFRRGASGEMTRLATHVSAKSSAIQRSLNRVNWKAFTAGALAFQTLRSIPEGEEAQEAFRQNNRDTMESGLRNAPIIGSVMSAYDSAVEFVHGAPPPAAGDVISGGSGLQQRATGGPFGRDPLLVGERGAELYFPNRSGFIATNRQLMQMQGAAQRIRAAGLATLSASVMGLPAAARPVTSGVGSAAGARVEINGGIHVTVPSGITDPEAIVGHLEARLGDRLAATLRASFTD